MLAFGKICSSCWAACPPNSLHSYGAQHAWHGGRMKSLILVLSVLFVCSATWAQTDPVPFVNQPLGPSSVPPGGPNFTLTVHGSGFVKGAAVNWDGSALATTFVNIDKLTAVVPASNIAVAASAAITVTNPAPSGGTSNVVYFAVSAPTTLQFTTSPS